MDTAQAIVLAICYEQKSTYSIRKESYSYSEVTGHNEASYSWYTKI